MKISNKLISVFLGLLVVFLAAALLFTTPDPIGVWLNDLENISYKLQLRHSHKSLSNNVPIAIIDIDDKSLAEQGRWPWPRKTLAELVEKLHAMGAKVIAFDVTFPEAELNIATEVLEGVQQSASPATLQALKNAEPRFDYDALLAKSLTSGHNVLGLIFTNEGDVRGFLPPPLFTIPTDQLLIPAMKSYMGNIELLGKAATHAGFINAAPDPDGVFRFAPLLLRYGTGIYPSLSLAATQIYLGVEKETLITQLYGGIAVLEGLSFGNQTIPLNPWGRILIPFRGSAYTFPYISAVDILKGRTPPKEIENKLLFIGSSAAAMGDIYPTAIAPAYPGVEIHASIAAGIIDNYLPYKPTWGKGVSLALIAILGTICAVSFPFLGPITAALLAFGLIFILAAVERWIWSHHGIVLPLFLPILIVLILFLLDLLYGYFFETRGRRAIRHLFDQYVSPAYLDLMMQKSADFGLKGENKEMAVFFSDIRGFTSLTETLTTAEITEYLNLYLTEMTKIIFDNQGTIDKYIGDAIMAFWGAPLEDPKQSFHAILTALEMQKRLTLFNRTIRKENQPEIQIGIGINTGNMHIGDLGSKFRRSYTVVGDAVNLASRLEGLTKFYQVKIIVGENTWQQTKDDFIFRKIDKVQVKGKKQAVEIYQPLCPTLEQSDELRAELEQHHHALDLYFHRDWEKSISLFETLQNSYPTNRPLYEVYLQQMRNTPLPGVDWDGSRIFEIK